MKSLNEISKWITDNIFEEELPPAVSTSLQTILIKLDSVESKLLINPTFNKNLNDLKTKLYSSDFTFEFKELFLLDCLSYFEELSKKNKKFVTQVYKQFVSMLLGQNSSNFIEKTNAYFSIKNDSKGSVLLTAINKTNGVLEQEIKLLISEFVTIASGNTVQLVLESVKNNEVLDQDTLEKTLSELNELIGLNTIKKEVNELVNFLKIQQLREKSNLKNANLSLHAVFLGPPGTGKTTVARLFGRIYKHLNMLTKGHLIEIDRSGLVASYVGQTSEKVDKVVNESLGGVLFIDEAYALVSDSSSDYGTEAVNILVKRMEDNRRDLAVITAGYTKPMEEFIESNPGLRSRFSRYFYFENFSAEELCQIFESFAKKNDFILEEDAKEKLIAGLDLLVSKADDQFGNARTVRNIFEEAIQNQANRLAIQKNVSKKALRILIESDLPEPSELPKKYLPINN